MQTRIIMVPIEIPVDTHPVTETDLITDIQNFARSQIEWDI